jgi:hypothetical protein
MWDNNIKMALREDVVVWTNLTQKKDQQRVLPNIITSLQVP